MSKMIDYWECKSLDGDTYQHPLHPTSCGVFKDTFEIYLEKKTHLIKIAHQGKIYNATSERILRSQRAEALSVISFFELIDHYSAPKQARALFEVFKKIVKGKRFALIPIKDQVWFTIENFSETEIRTGKYVHKASAPIPLPEPKKSLWRRFWDKYGYEVSDYCD